MKELLVVVDMVNGFVNEGVLGDKKINKITPYIVGLVKHAKSKGIDVVAFRDCHSKNDPEFKLFPPHCIKGTSESELIPELKPFANYMIDIPKTTTNGFKTTKFQQLILKEKYDKIFVVGCCTDICVKDFTESYLSFIKRNNLNTKIFVFEDACYTFDAPNHNAEQTHKRAIYNMAQKGAVVVNAKHLCENLER